VRGRLLTAVKPVRHLAGQVVLVVDLTGKTLCNLLMFDENFRYVAWFLNIPLIPVLILISSNFIVLNNMRHHTAHIIHMNNMGIKSILYYFRRSDIIPLVPGVPRAMRDGGSLYRQHAC
jgi:hypothetical protein